MLLSKKVKTYSIILIIFISIVTVTSPTNTKAENEFLLLFDALLGFGEALFDFDDPLNPHPFRYVGVWESNRAINLEGDMEFNLFFSQPIFTQIGLFDLINYRDDLNVSVYHATDISDVKLVKKTNVTLKAPEIIGDTYRNIQNIPIIKLENIDLTINKGEYLIFVIEIIQSKKPFNDLIANRFDTKTIKRVEWLAGILRQSEDPLLGEFATMIDLFLENITDLGIGGNEVANFINVLLSSAFYYGSEDYPSSVKFYTDENEDITVYFHSEYSDFQYENFYFLEETMIPCERIANEIKPTTNVEYAWPPLLTNPENLESINITENGNTEYIYWGILWILYTFEEIPDEFDENRMTLYLAEDKKLTISKPGTDSETISTELSRDEALVWTFSEFERNKILTGLTAYLNIHYAKLMTLGKVTIKVELKIDDKVIASDEQEIDRTNIVELIRRGPDVPTKFEFEDHTDREQIWYNDDLSLEVTIINKPLFGFLRPVKINYGSESYLSRIILNLEETENIIIDELPEEKKVYAGGSAHYELSIDSEYDDNIEVSVGELERTGGWNIEIIPDEFEITKNIVEKVDIYINSTAVDDSAYDTMDEIKFVINVTGKTGFDSKTSYTYVSREAVEYGFEVDVPKEIEVKHGENKDLNLVIRNKNKGFIADRYSISVTSENNFINQYNETEEIDVFVNGSEKNEEAKVNIIVTIPRYTYEDSDKLTVKIISFESDRHPPLYEKSFDVTVNIITPNILESIYRVFESAGEEIGLEGKWAGWIVIGICVLVLLFIIMIFVIIRKIKFVELICSERIKEITPNEIAKFEITVKNTYKYNFVYSILAKLQNTTKGFDISLDTTEISLQPGQSKTINLIVKPNDQVKKDDWAEVKIIVKPVDKKKTCAISTLTSINNGKKDIRITGVFHRPKVFKKGDRVETSFKIWNYGNVTTDKISIIFFVNDEEKNKIEDIIIPRGGYADIEIPWIAEKGRNELYIMVI